MPNDLPYQNLPEMFFAQADSLRNKTALLSKSQGAYTPISWSDFKSNVLKVARGLEKLGISTGDRVALLSENRPEWAYVDLGAQAIGACVVPIYATSSVKEVGYCIRHSEASIVFVSSTEQFYKVQPLLIEASSIRYVVIFDGAFQTTEARSFGWNQFLGVSQISEAEERGIYEKINKIQSDSLATIIYTSGTTGPPKGVMLTHRNFLINCWDAKHAIDLRSDDLTLSFLPLSHVFERTGGYYFPIMMGAAIAYAENMNKVPENLLEVRPTIACSVPRLYEKIYEKVMDKIESAPVLRKKIAHWAIRIGQATIPYRSNGRRLPFILNYQYRAATLLVFKKLQSQLGGRLRFFISGGAPLSRQIAEFFYAAGITILEGYGLTETSPVIAVNRIGQIKFGTVGLPFHHVKVRISDDGEILVQGPSIMKGYFKDETATAQVIQDGWFLTGDIGKIDPDGFLSITDRKKDIIVTSGGKNIAPQNIEGMLTRDPLIQQAVVLGDQHNFLVALIVPRFENLARHLSGKDLSKAEMVRHPEAVKLIEESIKEKTLELPNYEKIKIFRLLDEELSQDKGELTPTLKVKRRVVAERYAGLINGMYAEASERRKYDQSFSRENIGG